MTRFGSTMLYFVCWGLWYGTILGLVVGVAFHPIGMIMTFYGLGLGLVFGVLGSLWATTYHGLFFRDDVDIARYRRQAARASVLFVISLSVPMVILEGLSTGLPRQVLPSRIGGLLLVFSPLFLCISLTMAYTMRQHVMWLAYDLVAPEDLPPNAPNIADERNRLFKHIHNRWLTMPVCVPAACIQVYWINSNHFLFPCPESTLLVYVLFALITLFFTAYCAQGNAILITFIKVLILEDYFPSLSFHRHRIILTLISFFYTLITSWWTLILAPVYAVFMAYHVYHTLALPDDEGYEKAKRKEKVSMAPA